MVRCFATMGSGKATMHTSGMTGEDNHAKFPNHKEFFNDMYYQEEESGPNGPFDKQH